MSTQSPLFERTLSWLEEGRAVTWITIADTHGSSARAVGSMMAICDGVAFGSVSGGCVEDDLLELYGNGGPEAPTLHEFGIGLADGLHRGMPCGGRLVLVAEAITDKAHVEALIDAASKRDLISRTLDVASGTVTLGTNAESGYLRDAKRLTVAFTPAWRMIITGAGELSQHVAQMALLLGYQVEIIEPRESYSAGWPVKDCPVSTMLPDDYLTMLPPDEQTVVLALTHDKKLDDLTMLEALPSRAFYVGALGSARTQKARRERLSKYFDLDEMQIERLHGPIGIDLGTRAPAEIAIAILAEITAERNDVNLVASRATPALALRI